MEIFAVSRIIDDRGRNIGFGLYDTDTGQVKLVQIDQVKGAIDQGVVKVENLEVIQGIIKGSNGDIDRLPKVTAQGQSIGDSKCTIIRAVSDGTKTIGFDVVFFDGSCKQASHNELAFVYGVTNGKVINNNGDITVSSIRGNYKTRVVESAIKSANTADIDKKTVQRSEIDNKSALFRKGFNKVNLSKMREILDKTFEEIKEVYEIDLSIGSISFQSNRFTARLEANIVPSGKTKEQAQFEEHARRWGLSASDFERQFKHQNEIYKVIGAKPKADKYKIIGECITTGKEYVFTVDTVKNNFI